MNNDVGGESVPTRKSKTQGFSRVEGVLSALSSSLGLERRLKEHTLLQLYNTCVDQKLAGSTRALFIDSSRNLVVAARDASAAQELSLCRRALLHSISKLGRSLGVEIAGVRVDLKHFHRQEEPEPQITPPLPEPVEGDLDRLCLDSHEIASLEALRAGLEQESAQIRDAMIRLVERRLRLSKWRLANGYPTCGRCGNPARRLHASKQDKLCFSCAMEDRYPPADSREHRLPSADRQKR